MTKTREGTDPSPAWLSELGPAEVWRTDVLVVGGGVAGSVAALEAAPLRTLLLTKTEIGEGGSSPWAQGGMAAAVGHGDAAELHAADTRRVGRGLNDPQSVRLLAEGGPDVVERLEAWGVRFDRAPDGERALGREAGHGRRRILHAGGDATGRALVEALTARLVEAEHVRIEERAFAVDLLLERDRVVGVWGVRDGERFAVLARAVILATGGIGQLYEHTTNPPEVTGDGLAMAARAGALLADLEMVQFHPTALSLSSIAAAGETEDRRRLPLLTEALRGEGAHLLDHRGHRFMLDLHDAGELAPRDVVARACFRAARQGGAFLDVRHLERLRERFPTLADTCDRAGIDPLTTPLPVTPAAHYHMGGVLTDSAGRTSLEGLWACGEVTSTGVHGANRLASNSLLEGAVFGARVADDLRGGLPAPLRPGDRIRLAAPVPPAASAERQAEIACTVRRLMWERVGLERHEEGLVEAVEALHDLRRAGPTGCGESRNLLLVAGLVGAAALERRESRGGHYRSDHPRTDPAWQRRLLATLSPSDRTLRFALLPRLAPAAGAPAAGTPAAGDPSVRGGGEELPR